MKHCLKNKWKYRKPSRDKSKLVSRHGEISNRIAVIFQKKKSFKVKAQVKFYTRYQWQNADKRFPWYRFCTANADSGASRRKIRIKETIHETEDCVSIRALIIAQKNGDEKQTNVQISDWNLKVWSNGWHPFILKRLAN